MSNEGCCLIGPQRRRRRPEGESGAAHATCPLRSGKFSCCDCEACYLLVQAAKEKEKAKAKKEKAEAKREKAVAKKEKGEPPKKKPKKVEEAAARKAEPALQKKRKAPVKSAAKAARKVRASCGFTAFLSC
jgi:outer membrane biosynthesis protein TonB